jgi:regulator of RNase E activity RraA
MSDTVLTDEQLEALRGIDACALANAIESLRVRLRNEGFANGSIRCLFPRAQSMVGYAATLKIRGSSPPIDAEPPTERTDWWDYVLSLPKPRVLVIQDVSYKPGLGSLLGEVHVNLLERLGCVGGVTNGAVRDLPGVERTGFHLFAGSLAVSHAYVHVTEFGGPVEVGGLAIQSGDLLHGDRHGFQTVPRDHAAQLPPLAALLTKRERALIALCRTPGVSIEQLRSAVTAKSF